MVATGSLAYCIICMANHDLDEFRSFNCGHCFCLPCIELMFTNENGSRKAHYDCPGCRARIQRKDEHRIYIEIVDQKKAFVECVVEGLDKMDADSKLISVKKAEGKIKTARDKAEGDQELMIQLYQAILSFKERIIPVFTEIESHHAELAALKLSLAQSQAHVSTLEKQAKRVSVLEREASRLRAELREMDNQREMALGLAESAKDEVMTAREKVDVHVKRASDLEKDKKRMADQLEVHMNAANRNKVKMKALKDQIKTINERLEAKEREVQEAQEASQRHDYSDFNEYDGYELQSSQHPAPSFSRNAHTVNPSHHHRQQHNENTGPSFAFEAMPQPGFEFGGSWGQPLPARGTITKVGVDGKSRIVKAGVTAMKNMVTSTTLAPANVLKKKNANGNALGFPISLDRKGKPIAPVQMGPKHTIRVKY
ncbi:hypothetical protein BDQ12DRAFT_681045 [Crucibulum laeve]|uniref:RING-type domain-containing protein n=1 Tax=Crucibulum laeve TaxID=68775 RepID=A0A5C3M373_9AGAR|nr:hypothetical protein BDQ12DRAFT_681045 [Crucibulum laeve]